MDINPHTGRINSDLILKSMIDPKYRVYRHIMLIILLMAGFWNNKARFDEPVDSFTKTLGFVSLLIVFYLNMYYLVPRLLFRDRYLRYFLWLIFLFATVLFTTIFGRKLIIAYEIQKHVHYDNNSNVFFMMFVFLIIIGASAAVKLFQRWITDTQRINQLETTTIQSELEHLKKQINPHFLFNTLNNLNVLINKDTEKASQLVMKLSDLLRYQLYDSARSKVFLSSEIHFLEDFLNLEKIRRDYFEFTIMQQGVISGVEVPPLLFICFIENAVKHSMDAESATFVDIMIFVTGSELTFHCFNSKPRIKVESNKEGGLGLANVKRRLELLYPGRHNLSINDNHNRFNVELTINL